MTLDDLREQDVLLPEEEWGEHRLQTTVPEWRLAAAFALAGLCLVGVYLGDGGTVTWAATTVFLLSLLWITWICDRAILRQRSRFREEREALGGPSPRAAAGRGGRGGSPPGGEQADEGEGSGPGPPGRGFPGEG